MSDNTTSYWIVITVNLMQLCCFM